MVCPTNLHSYFANEVTLSGAVILCDPSPVGLVRQPSAQADIVPGHLLLRVGLGVRPPEVPRQAQNLAVYRSPVFVAGFERHSDPRTQE